MITIQLNGKIYRLEKSYSLLDFLTNKNYEAGCYAVMLNQNFLPVFYHATTFLCDGDAIDVITPMQGG